MHMFVLLEVPTKTLAEIHSMIDVQRVNRLMTVVQACVARRQRIGMRLTETDWRWDVFATDEYCGNERTNRWTNPDFYSKLHKKKAKAYCSYHHTNI